MRCQKFGVASSARLSRSSSRMTPPLLGSAAWSNAGTLPRRLELGALVDRAAWRRRRRRRSGRGRSRPFGPGQRLERAPPVLLERLALPREDGDALAEPPLCRRSPGGPRRPLPRRGPASRRCCTTPSGRPRPEVGERLDQHGRLHRHVQAAHDARAGERLLSAVAVRRSAIRPGISCSASDLVLGGLPSVRQYQQRSSYVLLGLYRWLIRQARAQLTSPWSGAPSLGFCTALY